LSYARRRKQLDLAEPRRGAEEGMKSKREKGKAGKQERKESLGREKFPEVNFSYLP